MADSSTSATQPVRRTGLSPKEQRLQALREKLAAEKAGVSKHASAAHTQGQGSAKATGGFKKTSFQRKAT